MLDRLLRIILVLLPALPFMPAAAAQPAPAAPERSITNITGQLYRAQNNNHYTVFLVTSDGVIMSDPINRDFARWLKAEIATRFRVPVRYVLYTHRDWDHASGGVVFADTAEFVGHVNMLTALAPPRGNPPLPEAEAKLDANRNGLIERAEAAPASAVGQRFDLFDYDRDGRITGAEVARGSLSDVYAPTTTFATPQHTVTLGGKRVTMVHLGTAHADDSVALYFPDERAVFSADVMQVKRLPNAISPSVGAYIDALATINALDFQYALTGHAMSGTRQDAMDAQQYLVDLANGVAAGIAQGRSLAEIQKTLTLDAYKGFERWDTVREAHIASVYATIRGTRASAPATR